MCVHGVPNVHECTESHQPAHENTPTNPERSELQKLKLLHKNQTTSRQQDVVIWTSNIRWVIHMLRFKPICVFYRLVKRVPFPIM